MLLLVLASVLVVALDDLASGFRRLGPRARGARAAGIAIVVAALVVLAPERAVLEKVLGRLAMPVGLLFAAGWLMSLRGLRRDPRASALTLGAVAIFAIIGNEYVGGLLVQRLEAPYHDIVPLAERPFDAVFVLGGGVAPTPDVELPGRSVTEEMEGQVGSSGDRVVLAARMHHAGLAPLLVASGRSVPGMGPRWESGQATAAIWRSLGVPEDAILVLEGDHNTTTEIRSYAALARERGFGRVGLITSAWHLPRAMRLARREGFLASPLPADRRGGVTYYGVVSLIPTGAGFDAVGRAAWESLGVAVGR